MNQISTGAAAHKPAAHPRAAAATVIDIMRTPSATAGQYDHPAAAAYLTKHPRTTAHGHGRAHRPAVGIITQADVTRAIADGKTSTTSGSMP